MNDIKKFLLFVITICTYQAEAQFQQVFSSSGNTPTTAPNNLKFTCGSMGAEFYRNIDGSCNNKMYFDFGQAGTALSRIVKPEYEDNNCGLVDRGNPREISNALFKKATNAPIEDARGLSSLVFSWLQFIDHDITLSPIDNTQPANIIVPANDPVFPANGEIEFHRSRTIPGTGTGSGNYCIQTNNLTAWIDGSQIYGSDEERANWLRTFTDGKLKVSPSANGDLLPCNTIDGNCNTATLDHDAPEMDRLSHLGDKVFVAGDVRASEQPGLASLHTLFVREHNRLCDLYLATGSFTDEELYQKARKMVGAQIQAITYKEMLPALGVRLSTYTGYRSQVDPSIRNAFALAAYRLGHSMVTPNIPLQLANCQTFTATIPSKNNGVSGPRPATYHGKVSTQEAFFNGALIEEIGIAPILHGLNAQVQEKIDRFVIEDLRSFLFSPNPNVPGLDLAAINLQRGRDHGLPNYNDLRKAYGLAPNTSYTAISCDPSTQVALHAAYPDINEMDAWSGMLSEDHLPNSSVGQTIAAIMTEQFENLRDGDRFWYQNDSKFSSMEIAALNNLRLSDIIKRNTGIERFTDAAYADCMQYCHPTNEAEIGIMHISGLALNNFSNHPTNASLENGHYSHFSSTVDLNVGQTVQATIYLNSIYLGNFSTDLAVWIDYNQDAQFEPSERIFFGSDLALVNYQETPVIFNFTIPNSAKTGETRLRIRNNMDDFKDELNACGSIRGVGEVEDYDIVISPPSTQRLADQQEPSFKEVSLAVNPNPVSRGNTNISMEIPEDMPVQLSLYNALGQKIWVRTLDLTAGRHQFPLDMEGNAAGNYYLHVRARQTILNKKLLLLGD